MQKPYKCLNGKHVDIIAYTSCCLCVRWLDAGIFNVKPKYTFSMED